MARVIIFISLSLFLLSFLEAQDDQILDFSLKGFSKEGERSWEIKGKSADISSEEVKLKDIEANLYGREKINLKSKEGVFLREKNLIHLEKDVRLETDSGATLKINSLDWDENKRLLFSEDVANIERENVFLKGKGLEAEPDLKKAQLNRDIFLEIRENPQNREIKISCDGPLEIDYNKRIAKFNKYVKVEDKEGQLTSDNMEVYFDISGENMDSWKIDRIKAFGNVKIKRGQNISFSQEAVYDAKEKKVTLMGEPKLVIYSEEELSLP